MINKTRTSSAKRITSKLLTAFLTETYGISPAQPIKLLEGGTESAAWLVKSELGSFVIKIFDANVPLSEVNEEARLYEYLLSGGIHVPKVRRTSQNSSCASLQLEELSFPTLVMEFEQQRMCTPSQVTKSELFKIGSETAKLHKVIRKYPYLTKKKINGTKSQSAFKAFTQCINSNSFTKKQLSTFSLTDANLVKIANSQDVELPLTETFLHADLALEHARILSNGEIYFFDFADRKWGSVSEELATFISMLYQWEDISFDKWRELKTVFLDGYQSVTTLTANDYEAVPAYIAVRILRSTRYLSILTKDEPSTHVVNWIRRGYELGKLLTSMGKN